MFTVMKQQIKDGLKDARFIFLAVLILAAFMINGLIFSEQYNADKESWQSSVRENTRLFEPTASNLQDLSNYEQTMVKPPSPLAFVSGGQEEKIPNSLTVNAFRYLNPETVTRDNRVMPVVPSVDWIFIIGSLMTLLAIFISYNSICGEKRDGTLSLVLSNNISRLQIFLGKYLGLMIVLVSTLLVGVFFNLTLLVISGTWSATAQLVEVLAYVLLFSILMLSLMVLLGVTVSSLTKQPAVSLVVLLVLWVGVVVVIPGLAWIFSEQMVKVPSNFELEREMTAAEEAIWDSKGPDAQNLMGDMFSENYRLWAEGWVEVLAMQERIRDDAVATQIRQAELNQTYSSLSPTGLLGASLQKLCLTGVDGFKSFYGSARRYQQQFHDFIVERDGADRNPENPHLVHSQGNRCVRGIFSTEPVEFATVPRWHNMFRTDSLPGESEFPVMEFIILMLENIFVAGIGFLAFARYDPR